MMGTPHVSRLERHQLVKDIQSLSCLSVLCIYVISFSSYLLVVVRRCHEQLYIVILSSVFILLCLSKEFNQ